MKRIIIILLIITMILSSCSTSKEQPKPSLNNNEEPFSSETNTQPTEKPEIIVINDEKYDHIDLYLPTVNRENRMTEDDELAFEAYLLSKFNLSVNIIYLNMNTENWASNIGDDGIIYFSDINTYEKLKEENLLLLLNDYTSRDLVSHDSYHFGVKVLANPGQELYGIPSLYYELYKIRMYHNETLEESNKFIPQSIDEFNTLAQVVKQKGGYIAYYYDNSKSFFTSFIDVFSSFGCQFNIRDITNISYNPITNKYELPILNDYFVEAMSYLQSMIEDDMIFTAKSSGQLEDKKIVTKTNFPSTSEMQEYSLSLYLEGIANEVIISVESYVSGFAIINGSRNIEGKLSFFYDYLFKSDELMYSFLYGREGYNYVYEDGNIIITLHSDRFGMQASPYIRIDYVLNQLPVHYAHIKNTNVFDEAIADFLYQLDNARKINPEVIFFDVNQYFDNEILDKYSIVLAKAANDFYNQVMHEKDPIEAALEIYSETVDKEGIIDYLQYLNSDK